ncbi:MAG: hypothetical protein IJP48_08675 [Synergistaceae bacterium]|nr:hypothetical protein [Synergistaceae bacterium]
MKFYDLEWLAEQCGTDNKYEITAKVAAEARRESEEYQIDKSIPANERFISNVLQEIEEGESPLNVKKHKSSSSKTAKAVNE